VSIVLHYFFIVPFFSGLYQIIDCWSASASAYTGYCASRVSFDRPACRVSTCMPARICPYCAC